MANPYLILWFDPTLNSLYAGWNQNTPANTPILKQGDNIGVELHWVRSGNANFPMEEVEFPPAADLTLAVGRLDTEPSSGAFVVNYGGDSTAELSYDITATNLQTALNGLASITAEGGVTVNKTGSNFRIVWNDPVVTANLLTADVNNLSPTSDSQVIVARAGSATDKQIILFSLKQAPIAACTTFSPSPSPAITVTPIFANTWRVTISPAPRSGTFSLVEHKGAATQQTDPIAPSASNTRVEQELDALTDGYFVVKSGEYSWDITAPVAVTNITANNALVGFSPMYGVLSMNTVEVEEFLAGNDSGTATLEVQADIGGEIQTLIQTDVTVINDLISTSIFNLVQLPDVMPVDAVVRYDTPQTATPSQQLQARQNIGAAASTEIAALVAEDVSLSGRITTIELDYVTEGELTTGLNTKAALVHTHTASQISDSSTVGRAVLTAADALTARGELGLGSISTFSSSDYLTTSGAASTYLSISSATANYLTQTNAASLYLTQTAAAANYLTISAASTTYLAQANNLSDLADAAVARQNLALGDTDAPTFATVTISAGVTSLTVTPYEITFPDSTTQNTRIVREQQANGSGFSTGGFDTSHYPYEVKVVATDGSEYWVPARPA